MHKDSQALQEYIISVCLNNKTALAMCMSHLTASRDFTGNNQRAFALMEAEYSSKGSVDGLVMAEKFINAKIFDGSTSRYIYGCYDGDIDFEPKMNQVKEYGVFRKAQLDWHEVDKLIKSDTTPENLSNKAIELVSRWGSGFENKYLTTEQVERDERQGNKGVHLRQGIHLLDEKLYKYAGQQKGTVKATIFREKHGKTRHACWEVAQDLRQGYKVLYVTTEGQASDIKNNIKEILKYDWDRLKENLYYKDGTTDVMEIKTAIVEWHFLEKGDKVVVDHLQRVQHPDGRRMNENTEGNKCCMELTNLAVKYDLNIHLINQSRQPDMGKTGYSTVPKVYDCYGSNQLIKDASIILVGFRPNTEDGLLLDTVIGGLKVKDPDGGEAPYHSVFVKPILSRKKMDYLHRWIHFRDSDDGYELYKNDLL